MTKFAYVTNVPCLSPSLYLAGFKWFTEYVESNIKTIVLHSATLGFWLTAELQTSQLMY